jgi:hypothetical protein
LSCHSLMDGLPSRRDYRARLFVRKASAFRGPFPRHTAGFEARSSTSRGGTELLRSGAPTKLDPATTGAGVGAFAVAAHLSGRLSSDPLDMARAAFTTPLDSIAEVSAGLFIVFVTFALRHIRARGRDAHAESDDVGAVGESAAN